MKRLQVWRRVQGRAFQMGLALSGLLLVMVMAAAPAARPVLEPIRQGSRNRPQVALAINVAWGNEYLPELLAVLKRHQAVGTFFLVGNWAERFPDLARGIADAGHEIASHGYATVDYQGLSADGLRHQVDDAADAIQKATGQRPVLFSPHKGEWTPALLALLEERKYLPIHWTVDTVDWQNPPPDEMAARVLSRVGPGSIILLHPTEAAVRGLDGVLAGLEEKGLRVVRVSTLLEPDPSVGGGPSVWEPDTGVQAVWGPPQPISP
ncbi:MAG: polysaccharide deacetylase family protein [Bacillota bacterium]